MWWKTFLENFCSGKDKLFASQETLYCNTVVDGGGGVFFMVPLISMLFYNDIVSAHVMFSL